MRTSFTPGNWETPEEQRQRARNGLPVQKRNNHIPQTNRPHFRKYSGSSQSKHSLHIYVCNNKRLHPQPSALSFPVFPPGVLCSSSIGYPLLIYRPWTCTSPVSSSLRLQLSTKGAPAFSLSLFLFLSWLVLFYFFLKFVFMNHL